MARQEHVLTVFVASPSDVEDERTRLEEVIGELNVTWSRDLGVRLDLVRWETHAYPGRGEDAQDVINQQIPNDYDIFVGLMWCRYGTATGRAGSGTVEEFERAKARSDADSKSVRFLVYFKETPIAPSRVDPAQLAKVNDFRESLGQEGVLYWSFTSQEQFEKLVRLHLTRQVQTWKAQLDQPPDNTTQQDSREQIDHLDDEGNDEDDLGILDLMDIVEDRFEQLTATSNRISAATRDIGRKMADRTTQMNTLPRDSQGIANRKAAKRLISMAASDMDEYTARMEADIPIFSNSLNDAMNALIRVSTMSVDFGSDADSADQAEAALNGITVLLDVLTTSEQSTSEFRDSIAGLPRMTSELNRSKRGVANVLDTLIAELSNGQSLLREAEAVVRSLLGE